MKSRNHIKAKKSAAFVKKDLKMNRLHIKKIGKLGTIVIIQENIEVLRIVHLMQSTVYLKKFL